LKIENGLPTQIGAAIVDEDDLVTVGKPRERRFKTNAQFA
jgi:hypothetical protein